MATAQRLLNQLLGDIAQDSHIETNDDPATFRTELEQVVVKRVSEMTDKEVATLVRRIIGATAGPPSASVIFQGSMPHDAAGSFERSWRSQLGIWLMALSWNRYWQRRQPPPPE